VVALDRHLGSSNACYEQSLREKRVATLLEGIVDDHWLSDREELVCPGGHPK